MKYIIILLTYLLIFPCFASTDCPTSNGFSIQVVSSFDKANNFVIVPRYQGFYALTVQIEGHQIALTPAQSSFLLSYIIYRNFLGINELQQYGLDSIAKNLGYLVEAHEAPFPYDTMKKLNHSITNGILLIGPNGGGGGDVAVHRL